MAAPERVAFIRNIAEVPWREFPNHFGGALSKPLVMPETAGSHHLDYRISMYQPMAHVARHKHRVQEQVYHVLEGEGLMEIAGQNHVVRRHDVIFPAPGRRACDLEHRSGRSGVSGDHVAGDGWRGAGLRGADEGNTMHRWCIVFRSVTA
jgi:mannose-6-phosphate isomerase-like protein (cupin superfamily)